MLFIALLIQNGIFAQLIISPVSNQTAANGISGIYYALPLTSFKIDVLVTKTEHIPGPYHAWAEKYLGLDNVRSFSSTSFKLNDVDVSAFIKPDPDHYYFIEYGDRELKEEIPLKISLSEAGIITGINEINAPGVKEDIIIEKEIDISSRDELFKYLAEDNLFEKIDTTRRRITIDTLTIEKHFYKSTWIQKTTEQKASDAADFITRIRENRFLLISGYQEVNYGESIEYMDKSLQELEEEYLSLFTGVTLTSVFEYSYYLTPEIDDVNNNIQLFKFSESRGVENLQSGSGSDVVITFIPSGIVGTLGQYVENKNSQQLAGQGFYYRIPEYADILVKHNNQDYYKSNMQVCQFGLVTFGPLNNPGIKFYPESGGIQSFEIDNN